LGRYKEAEAEMNEALRLRQDRETLAALGALMAYEKRHVESSAFYERALASGPETYLVLSNLADSYRRTERSSEARRAYQRALRIADHELIEDPRSGPARVMVGYVSARLGDRARAERETGQALRLSPEHAEVLRRAVLTYDVLGNRDQILKVLQNAPSTVIGELSRQPDLAELHRDPRFMSLIPQSALK
jgi:tetratricopeptide (TPR) repeat protein